MHRGSQVLKVLAIAISSCGGSPGVNLSLDAVPGLGDAGADAVIEAAADTTAATGSEVSSVQDGSSTRCADTAGKTWDFYYPSGVGSSWTTSVTTTSGSKWTEVRTIVTRTPTGFVSRTISDPADIRPITTSTYHIDADGMTHSTDVRASSVDGGRNALTSYTPSLLLMPFNITAGCTASRTSTATNGSEFGPIDPNATITTRRDIIVDGVEEITVPAGTFSAMKITTNLTEMLSSGQVNERQNIRWYAPGIGPIKTVNLPGPQTWELLSFQTNAGP